MRVPPTIPTTLLPRLAQTPNGGKSAGGRQRIHPTADMLTQSLSTPEGGPAVLADDASAPSNSERHSLNELPRELLLCVFQFIPLTNLLRLRGVCRLWWTDVLHMVALRLRTAVEPQVPTPEQKSVPKTELIVVRALTDGDWYKENLRSAALSCLKVQGSLRVFEQPDRDDSRVSSVSGMQSVRFVFKPVEDSKQWPLLGYYTNGEGQIGLEINGWTFTLADSVIGSLSSKRVSHRDNDISLSYSVQGRPDITPDTAEAKGIPMWWPRRGVWGMPSECYFREIRVDEFSMTVEFLMKLLPGCGTALLEQTEAPSTGRRAVRED
ncbi:uncharacterized protein EV422DRAFT_204758 [Fimicolochytrium jonesii]|uniref:uncharacterized protein n=1 Tax=Fimicolochytrium jonesii TaxID=1396493 RepID=UPI0022FDE74F|nr:uncharacterized protein EV422DRAFT_204758 [Fimicolochytrium jonesii]KAI8818078.1 hypothetical protein EV422DRAFT_204758 [Fimicolochytrium jonesii]